MKLNLILVFVITIAVSAAGCGGPAERQANVENGSSANSNLGGGGGGAYEGNSNTPLDPIKKPEAATENHAPTLAPVVQGYYEALRKKDDALLRSVMSAEFLKSVEADMKEDKETGGMAAYLAKFDTIPEKPVEVRNERIEGNNGVAELKGGAYVKWTPFAFVNEGGRWKLTGGSPVLK